MNEDIQNQLKNFLEKCTHVVIKIGTGVLNPHIEKTDFTFFEVLAREIKQLQSLNKNVLIVSSGAVGFGKKIRRKKVSPDKMGNSTVDKQAYAALGQGFLIDTYREYLEKADLDVAQILLSMSDFKSRNHFHNMKRALDQLLDWKCIPVINENDTVAIDEKFGDNDTLSAMIAGMYPMSCLIILTTIDGFYLNDRKMDLIQEIDSEHLKSAKGASTGGVGGMRTKLYAARKLIRSGQVLNIAPGKDPSVISQVFAGEKIGTWFVPVSLEPVGAKKRWLMHYRHSMGEIVIDEGARRALTSGGASLLAVGVKKVSGIFKKGDVVTLYDQAGDMLGLGTSSMSSADAEKFLKGNGEKKGVEFIHRDNLALLIKS